MTEPAETVTLTWQHLRTLLESARGGDSIDDAMLQAEQWQAQRCDDPAPVIGDWAPEICEKPIGHTGAHRAGKTTWHRIINEEQPDG